MKVSTSIRILATHNPNDYLIIPHNSGTVGQEERAVNLYHELRGNRGSFVGRAGKSRFSAKLFSGFGSTSTSRYL